MITKSNTLCVVVLLLFCSIICSSCNSVCSCKKVQCPAYNNVHFDQWFPYQSSQQIVFADTAQAAGNDTITISNISATDTYEANKGCYNGAAGCASDKYVNANNFSVSYNSTNDWDGIAVDSNYSFTIKDFSMQAKGIGNEGFVNVTLPSHFYNIIRLGGKEYANVEVIIKEDTTSVKDFIYQVYIQKNIGLLAYRYYPSQTLFVKK